VPYRGSAPIVGDLVGGHLPFGITTIADAIPQHRAGGIRILAVTSAMRSPFLPEVPTLKEIGYDIEYYLWVGLFAPKGTPDGVVTYLRQVLNTAAHSDQYRSALANLGQELDYMDLPEFATFWAADTKRIEAAIRAIGKVEG